MQEMNRDESFAYATNISSEYERERVYRGDDLPLWGQKIGDDDARLHDLLRRHMNREMQSDTHKTGEHSIGQRFLLALVSICALVAMFGFVVVALAFAHLSANATALLGAAMFFLLGAIIIINATFNSPPSAVQTRKKKKLSE